MTKEGDKMRKGKRKSERMIDDKRRNDKTMQIGIELGKERK